MSIDNKGQWLKDFTEFSQVDSNTVKVPESLFVTIKNRLFPSPWVVFSKISVLHLVVGFLSLGICHQFGLNPFNTERSLADWFMTVGGHEFCMLACGIFFMATTFLLSNLWLSLEELETIRRFEWLQSSLIIFVSIAAFYFFGAELVASIVGLWALGAIIGAFISIEGSFRLRQAWA
jgi:hypothetical protein